MDLGVFYEVIVPLMEVEGTATICISTPLGSFNFYSELTRITDDKGKPIFKVRHITGNKPPPWKEESARSKVEAIYGNRTTLKKREIYGEIADDGENMAFDLEKIKRFMDKPPLTSPYRINDNIIYVSVDPNGGASATNAPGSDTAIVSFCISEGRVVVSCFVLWGVCVLLGRVCARARVVFLFRDLLAILANNPRNQCWLVCEIALHAHLNKLG